MNKDISIEVQEWLPDATYPEVGALNGEIVISLDGQPITANRDRQGFHDGALVSARRCAIWFLQNWWRLRWEPAPSPARELPTSWRLAHEMRSIGGGYHWPGLTFSSDGVLTNIWSRASGSRPTQPMYFVDFENRKVPAESFEEAIDDFISAVLAQARARCIDVSELVELNETLTQERSDKATALKRRREALLGFDPEEAPFSLVATLERLVGSAGNEAVDELAAVLPWLFDSPTDAEANALFDSLDLDDAQSFTLGDIEASSAIRRSFLSDTGKPADRPWKRAVAAARATRAHWSLESEPLSTPDLAAKLDISPQLLNSDQTGNSPFGIAFGTANDELRVSLRRRRLEARRFELCRMLGDFLFLNETDYWRPVTEVRTARQQFQRAYSAELLCPFDALRDRLAAHPAIDIETWADEFGVDELVVRYQLVNNGVYVES